MQNKTDTSLSMLNTSSPRSYYVLLITQTAIGLIAVIANLLLLVALKRLKSAHLKTSTKAFFTLEAVSHLCFGITFIIRPHAKAGGCGIIGLALSIFSGLTITGIFLLSVDIFLPMLKPWTHQKILTGRVAKLCVLSVVTFWVVVCSVSYFIEMPEIDREAEHCSINDSQQQPAMVLSMSTLCLLMMQTSVVLQACTVYLIKIRLSRSLTTDATDPRVATISHLVSQGRGHLIQPQAQGTQRQTRQYRLVKILMLSMCATYICLMPSNVTVFSTALSDVLAIPVGGMDSVRPQLAALALVECALYPCIVLARSTELRASLGVKSCITVTVT